MRSRSITLSLVAAAVAVIIVGTGLPPVAAAVPTAIQQQPEGYEQILPRGRIAAIDDPEWVDASAAGLPDNAWVLGVVIEGQARAFSINLLNFHEVVNDKIGDTAYAAVW